MSRPNASARAQIEDGWFVFAAILIDRFGAAPGNARQTVRSPGAPGLIRRFRGWWSRPSDNAAWTGSSRALDAATRLEIRSLGGRPR